jgi:hypothetical protein
VEVQKRSGASGTSGSVEVQDQVFVSGKCRNDQCMEVQEVVAGSSDAGSGRNIRWKCRIK